MCSRVVLVVLCYIKWCSSANILCVFPTPAISPHTVFNVYVNKLVQANHNVTVLTPYTMNNTRITEIILVSNQFRSLMGGVGGVVVDEHMVIGFNYMRLVQALVTQFDELEVQRFLHNRGNKFDLVVVEAYLSYLLIFGHLYNAPVVQFSSGYAIPENFETMGAVARHPFKHPNIWRNFFNKEYHDQINSEIMLKAEWQRFDFEQEKILKRKFHITNIDTLKRRIKLLFVNVPTIYDNYRAVPESVQYLGKLHLSQSEEPLRDYELQKFLDGGPTVYVSFGSLIRFDYMPFVEKLRTQLCSLPYRVLLKIDPFILNGTTTKLCTLPYWMIDSFISTTTSRKILVRNWFPQRALLKHPNIVAFVTQAGVLSTDEAIDAEVPLVGVPMIGDQFFTANRYVKLGIGISVDISTEKYLASKIRAVVESPHYKRNIKKIKTIINDVPMKSAHKAVWYTNYVIRNYK
ncbi:egt [Hyphantria cunea granulovirus]|uniref:Egt n=1 Tax=Hyphantria cunea granulovirus TaxID=307448 RepID=A0AAE6D0K6_9BBAC|nr:egt [Hyphantria cunea granulovirus]QBQ01683.1 egt [Hyphantria cunea granulovirus]